MKNRKKQTISIIIPIYNAKNTLKRCLDSVVNQTYQELEIILIDDGSTDNSLAICQLLQKQDNRVVIVSQKNQGVSVARNKGIEMAEGEYLAFADSDDYLDHHYLEALMQGMYDSDLVICGFHRLSEDDIITVLPKAEGVFPVSVEVIDIMEQDQLLNIIWNKLYKMEYMTARFSPEVSLGEDLLFNLEYLKKIDQVTVLNQALYYYQMDSPLSLSKKNRGDAYDIFQMLYGNVTGFIKHTLGSEIPNSVYRHYFNNLVYSIIKKEAVNDNYSKKEKKAHLKKILHSEPVLEIIRAFIPQNNHERVWKFLISRQMAGLILLLGSIK